MTTTTWQSAGISTTDADFRAWGSAISAALAAIGLTQTSDTGQVNWSTVTRPAASSLGGYEVWRFNDAAQSSRPIFFRIEYRAGGIDTRPATAFTVGTGSNGSGTITGVTHTMGNHTPLYSSATLLTSAACYDPVTGTFWLAHWHSTLTPSRTFAIARGWNKAESTQKDDFFGSFDWQSSTIASAVVFKHPGQNYTQQLILTNHPMHGFRWGPFDTMIAARFYGWAGEVVYFPGFLVSTYSDWLFGNDIVASPGGVEHHYLQLSLAGTPQTPLVGAVNGNTRLVALWE